jgi:hypothetical protein
MPGPCFFSFGTPPTPWSPGQAVVAIQRDGYSGWFTLETHSRGPAGDQLEASWAEKTGMALPIYAATSTHARPYFFFSKFHSSRDNTRPQNGQ